MISWLTFVEKPICIPLCIEILYCTEKKELIISKVGWYSYGNNNSENKTKITSIYEEWYYLLILKATYNETAGCKALVHTSYQNLAIK